MTNRNPKAYTAIDIRKVLIAAGLKPSDYDEQAIWEAQPTTDYAVLTYASEHPKGA